MNHEQLLQQGQEVIATQPGLHIEEQAENMVLVGKYILDGIYEGVPFFEEFYLEITVPWCYPFGIPTIRETEGRIRDVPGFGHIFGDDMRFCLGAPCDLVDRIQSSTSLLDFLNSVLPSYLYGYLYTKKYGTAPPYGERAHGTKGLEEAYRERYHISDDSSFYQLLGILCGIRPYRGHLPCPCKSGKNCATVMALQF